MSRRYTSRRRISMTQNCHHHSYSESDGERSNVHCEYSDRCGDVTSSQRTNVVPMNETVNNKIARYISEHIMILNWRGRNIPGVIKVRKYTLF